jgi:hypothetical protein
VMIAGFSRHEEFKALGEKLFAHVAVSLSRGSITSGPQRVHDISIGKMRLRKGGLLLNLPALVGRVRG